MTYTVEFGKSSYHLQEEMAKWCGENIGSNPPYTSWVYDTPTEWEGLGKWCMTSAFGSTFFYFREDTDRTAFLLRWS